MTTAKNWDSSEMCATMVAEDDPAEQECLDCLEEDEELLSVADFEFIGKLLVAD